MEGLIQNHVCGRNEPRRKVEGLIQSQSRCSADVQLLDARITMEEMLCMGPMQWKGEHLSLMRADFKGNT